MCFVFLGGQWHHLERGPLLQCSSSRCRLRGGARFQSGYPRAEGNYDHTRLVFWKKNKGCMTFDWSWLHILKKRKRKHRTNRGNIEWWSVPRWLTDSCLSRMVSLWSALLDTTQRKALPCKATQPSPHSVGDLCIYKYLRRNRLISNRNDINH